MKKRTILLFLMMCSLAFPFPFICSDLVAGLKVYPRLITPGSPPGNERIYFEFPEIGDVRPVLRIISINGEKIAEISTANPNPLPAGWRLSWDGRDNNGNLVLPGVYIYQWEDGKKRINGTIVVAR